MKHFFRAVAICLLASTPLLAAVSNDTKFEKGTTAPASPFAFVSNAGTVTGTVGSNTNRCLVGYAVFRAGTESVVAMTWAGNTMTSLGTALSITGSAKFDLYLFGLKGDGAGGVTTGNQSLSLSWTGSASGAVILGAVSLFNCDQTTTFQNYSTNTATSTAPSVTVSSANGNMIVAGNSDDDASSGAINVGTSAWSERGFTGNYAMGYNASSGSSTTVSWTNGSSVLWGVVGVDVIAVGGGGGGATPELSKRSKLQKLGIQ